MKTVKIQITGVSPLLINKVDGQIGGDNVRKANKLDLPSPEQDARNRLYKNEKGKLYVPASWIIGSLKGAGSDYKQRGTKKTLKNVLGCSVFFNDEAIELDGNLTEKDIQVDSRFVVVSRGRVMRHRPKLQDWSVTFTVEVDESLVGLETLAGILSDAGRRIGLGDFRPQKGGTFGRYKVTRFEELKNKQAA